MIKQYPHFLFVKTQGEAVQDPATGNWVEQPASWVQHTVCREEPNGKGTLINGQDGRAIVFSSAVYMPKSASRIAEGSEVYVCEAADGNGIARVKGQVLKFEVGQLNCRLWL